MAQLHDLTALAQAAAVRAGDVSPSELVEHYLDRIEAYGTALGAFVTVTAELARAEAARPLPTGELAGVPTAIKDLTMTAGTRTTFGSAAFADYVPTVDSDVVVLMRDAGLISLGKTTTSEFGVSLYSETGWRRRRATHGPVTAPPEARAAARPRRSPPAGAIGPRQRRRRFATHPGVDVRSGRLQAQPRPGQRWSAGVRRLWPAHQRTDRPYGRRRRGPARRPGGAGRGGALPGTCPPGGGLPRRRAAARRLPAHGPSATGWAGT
jgi:hypothetical protein